MMMTVEEEVEGDKIIPKKMIGCRVKPAAFLLFAFQQLAGKSCQLS
jgi:hypothetical protein